MLQKLDMGQVRKDYTILCHPCGVNENLMGGSKKIKATHQEIFWGVRFATTL